MASGVSATCCASTRKRPSVSAGVGRRCWSSSEPNWRCWNSVRRIIPTPPVLLMASRRYGRYLSEDERGRPRLDAAKVKAAEKFDGKFVVISNDDTLSAEDIALGYKGGWIIESCFRRIKQTGLQVRPMFHWTPRRIEAHVKLCVLALQVQRAAEIRCQLPWARIAHTLGGLKAVRYRCESRTIVQRSKITAELSAMLKTLKVSVPKQILLVE